MNHIDHKFILVHLKKKPIVSNRFKIMLTIRSILNIYIQTKPPILKNKNLLQYKNIPKQNDLYAINFLYLFINQP